MLHGERGEVCVVNEVCLNPRRRNERTEDFAVTLRGLGYLHPVAVESRHDLSPSLGGRFGLREHSRIGRKAQKRDQALPGQPDRRRAVQALIGTPACALVLGKRADVGVCEEVRIDQDHLNDSPSAAVSTSETLSTLPTRQRPSDTALVRRGHRRGAGAAIWPKPRRSASFTASFKLTLRVLRSRSSAAATSLSGISVVRMHHSVKMLMPRRQ